MDLWLAPNGINVKTVPFSLPEQQRMANQYKDKILALILYLSGLSMNMTAQIIGVSTQTVMRWVRLFYHKFASPVQHISTIEEIEVDEMHSYLGKKRAYHLAFLAVSIWSRRARDAGTLYL